ncbi:MAG TPA: arginase family protein, partial [bacterium]|nr:arginase family protein [bacterium]
MTFLAASTAPVPREGKGAVAIIGVPFDGTSTFRRGSRHGPAAIRWASQSIETYSPVLRRELENVELFDGGDLDVAGAGVDGMRSAADAHLAALPSRAIPAVLGGEHTATLPVVERLHRSHRDLAVLQLDAHTDLRDEYEGLTVSHATIMRRVADLVGAQSVVQIGTRAGTAGEFDTARSLRYTSPTLNMPQEVWSWLEHRPVY